MARPRLRYRHASATLPAGRDLHPLLSRVYAQRGIADAAELDLSLRHLLDPSALSGLGEALNLLERALSGGQRILIVGDFDADGATSTALMLRCLWAMGARHVDYLVPNRFEYGYGLTPEIVGLAVGKAPDLLITVDNGISSLAGVAVARAQGIRVLVTDHHLPGSQLPAADAIVNPNLPGDRYPSKNLAGVGVAFYVLAALRARLRGRGWFQEQGLAEPRMADFLDLVALGTVADVVPLDRNNRILVEQGLALIRSGRGSLGVRSLLEVAGRDANEVVACDLGFAAGPRLNAAGRLQDMGMGIECLLTDERKRAFALAQELDGLNRERRVLEQQMQEEALRLVDRVDCARSGAGLPHGICLYEAGWHQGVIGILASRIKERYHRPVITFADAGEGMLKGSARSVSGLHIRDVLDGIATQRPGIIERFGGHAMAAGLSLHRGKLAAFREAFEEAAAQALGTDLLRAEVWSDGTLEVSEVNLAAAEALRRGGPWGQGFPEPLFDGRFRVASWRRVGERHLKLQLEPEQGGCRRLEAIAFNKADEAPPGELWHLVYRLDVNTYQGMRRPQLVVDHLWSCE